MLHQFLGVYTRRVYCIATSASSLWVTEKKGEIVVKQTKIRQHRSIVSRYMCKAEEEEEKEATVNN
jgi:hypothetical protein